MSAYEGRPYYVACVCLLIVAVALRFYDLPEDSLRYDEMIAANNSKGTFSEVISNTRHFNSSPILYPVVLYAVQKVESTRFSVRVVPAVASVLTIAVMLFLLPRAGFSRWAAFLAAILAVFSVAAIRHAQDVREYSVDALVAAFMIAGLLWYLRDGKKALLCASLFVAPLLQYGLVLFGAAVIGAALVLLPTRAGQGWLSYQSRLWSWLKQRIDLLWPVAFFLAGSVISYVVTLQSQWRGEGWTGYDIYYYQGGLDVGRLFEFAASRTQDLLDYHLPQGIVILAVGAFALLLLSASMKHLDSRFRGNGEGEIKFHGNAIIVLFLFCIAIAIGAAMLVVYPLGGIRQNIYLGPILFLTTGLVFDSMAENLSSLTRRVWLSPALFIMFAGAIVFIGVDAMRQNNPYQVSQGIKDVLAILEEQAQAEDMVYISGQAVPAMMFYEEEKPGNYHYLEPCWSPEECSRIQETIALAASKDNSANRIWLVQLIQEELGKWTEQASIDQVIADGRVGLYLVTNFKKVGLREQVIRSYFDVYLRENTLTYVKAPCVPADTEAPFFLHLIPADEDDLPEHRKQYGFNNLDFDFANYRLRFDEKCIAQRALPAYAIIGVRTGQFTPREGQVWRVEFPVGRFGSGR